MRARSLQDGAEQGATRCSHGVEINEYPKRFDLEAAEGRLQVRLLGLTGRACNGSFVCVQVPLLRAYFVPGHSEEGAARQLVIPCGDGISVTLPAMPGV